jgi:hypothetical protein
MRTRVSLGLLILPTLAAIALLTDPRLTAQSAPLVPYPLVFVSRQIPDQGSIYWNVPKDQPGVGPHSRFRLAAPGQLVVRNTDGTLHVLIDGGTPASTAPFNLVDVDAPEVSYDGQWIAFAGVPQSANTSDNRNPVKNPSAWRIYLIRADGTGLRRVTPDENRSAIPANMQAYDDTDPCWLPDGRLVFTSTRWPSFAQYSGVRTSNLYIANIDGSGLHRITAERNGADRPLIDPLTGRIVFSRWWRNHRMPLDSLATVADPSGGYIQKDGLSADRNLEMTGDPQYADFLFRNAWHPAVINPDGTGLAMWSGSLVNTGISGNDERNHLYGGGFSPSGELYANFFPMYNMTEAAGFGGIRKFTRASDGVTNPYTPILGITTVSTSNFAHTSPNSYGIYNSAVGYVTEPEVLPDGRVIVSRAVDYNQDYGLYVMNADGSNLTPVYDRAGTTELRARAIRPRTAPPVLAETVTQVPSLVPPTADGPYDVDGMFVFDALNVYFNAPVDSDIISAPAIGSAASIRFFIDHQRTSPGSFPNLDWPILLDEMTIKADGSVAAHAPANVPLFEQLRTSDGHVPFTNPPFQTGSGHVAGMNYGRPGATARCVGCHMGHSQVPSPATDAAAKWTNLAPGAAVTVSSTRDASQNNGVIDRRVMKGEIWRYWVAANGQSANQWVKLTFPVSIRVSAVRLYNPRPGDEAHSTLQVPSATVTLYSDAAATQPAGSQSVGALAVSGTTATFATPVVARAVRVDLGTVTGTFYGAHAAGLAEIEVIASGDITSTDPPPPTDPPTPGPPVPPTTDPPGNAPPLTPTDPPPASAVNTYFAEGASGDVFNYRLAVLNTTATDTQVYVQYLRQGAAPLTRSYVMPAHARITIAGADVPELRNASFGAIVTAIPGVIAERTMSWDTGGDMNDATTAKALGAPSMSWYLAEGNSGFFDTFILLVNPSSTMTAHASVSFFTQSGQVVQTSRDVGPNQRVTIVTADIPELLMQSFGTTVLSDAPILVERAMYFRNGQPMFVGGAAAGAVPAPATHWFLPEGQAGGFFSTFVLVANPNPSPVDLTVRYLTAAGVARTDHLTLAATQRWTVNLNDLPELNNSDVSTDISASAPVVAERSMYWPNPGPWYGSHNSLGLTELATRWGLAEGQVGGPQSASTYILLANPGTTAADVTLTFYRESALAPFTITRTVPPGTRMTIDCAAEALSNGERFGAVVSSTQPIAVEHSMYWNTGAKLWGSGSNETGIKLP